jgi:hypothetical protein
LLVPRDAAVPLPAPPSLHETRPRRRARAVLRCDADAFGGRQGETDTGHGY